MSIDKFGKSLFKHYYQTQLKDKERDTIIGETQHLLLTRELYGFINFTITGTINNKTHKYSLSNLSEHYEVPLEKTCIITHVYLAPYNINVLINDQGVKKENLVGYKLNFGDKISFKPTIVIAGGLGTHCFIEFVVKYLI